MKATEGTSESVKDTPASSTEPVTSSTQRHAARFTKAVDGRKQEIRGLWVRNGRYYAQLKVENPITGIKKVKRIPLKDQDGNPVATVAEARAQMARLQTQRADNTLPVLSRTPRFADYAKTYIAGLENAAGEAKKKAESTVAKEKAMLGEWTDSIGDLRLDQIKRVHVNRFENKLIADGNSTRTANLYVGTLRFVLKNALAEGIIQRLPMEGRRPLQTVHTRRPFFSNAEIEKLCAAAVAKKEDGTLVTKNGKEFADYIRFMAFSGTRRNEALAVRWDDINWQTGQIHVWQQVTPKGLTRLKGKSDRHVDMNPKLAALLKDMQERSKNTSEWLFPSPQRGDKDIPAKSFRESLDLAKEKAKLPSFGFHDCRHHFISMCVMSGVDFMTIAEWVGHKDGGVLIGKVYGHLANEHRREMASKLNFGPVVVATAVNQ